MPHGIEAVNKSNVIILPRKPRPEKFVWKQQIIESTLGSNAKFVAVILVDFLNEDRGLKAWPSIDTLAKCTSLSPSTVRRALRELEASGFLCNERPGGGIGRDEEGHIFAKTGLYSIRTLST